MIEAIGTRRRRRHPIALAVIFGAASIISGAGAYAAAPVDEATDSVDTKIETVTEGEDPQPQVKAQQQAQQSSPAGSANAKGSAVSLSLLENHIVTISGTNASAGAHADSEATVVAVLGHTVIGSEASSGSGESESTTGLAHETCEASDGQLCLALLYGTASADQTDSGSSSSADTAVASACVGGNQTDPMTECEGPISIVVAESHSDAARNSDGSAEASQYTALADLCLGGENAQSGVCEGLGVLLLPASSSSSAAPGEQGDGSGDAATAVIESGGEEAFAVDQAQEIALPPDCPSSGAICIALSQVATSASAGTAESGATGVDVQVPTPNGDLVDGQISDGQASGSAARTQVLGERTEDEPQARPGGGRLATTGSDIVRMLILAAMVLSAGFVLRSRHRETRTDAA